MRDMKPMRIVMPADPNPDDRVAFKKWKLDLCKVDKQWEMINNNMQQAFAGIYNQCSPRMKTKLKGMMGIYAAMLKQDVVKLLEAIRSVYTEDRGRRHDVMTMVQAKKKVGIFYQQADQSNDNYAEELASPIEIVEFQGGQYGYEPNVLNGVLKDFIGKDIQRMK